MSARLAVWRARLGGLVALLAVALFVVPVGSPGELVALAAVATALTVALVALGAGEPGAPRVAVRARVLRLCAERLAFLRTRDPDAAGRVRPRAPGWTVAAG